jgi:DNA topoisomerase-1
VEVDKRVYKNVKLFMENKKDGDDLFDRLNTSVLNQYLNGLMDGLTAKVFRTFNASFTLQQQLDDLTDKDDNVAAKMLAYNRANRAVAVLCNHQRAVPKQHETGMANLDKKLEEKQDVIKKAEKDLKHAKKAYKSGGGNADKAAVDKAKKRVEKLLEELEKLEIQKTDKDENKTISLGTSKLNYLDPRISVQWCKTHEVPIEKVCML